MAPQQSLPEVYYPAAIPVAPYRGENIASIPLKSFNPYPDTTAFAETPKSSYPGTNSILTYDNQSTRGALPPAEQPSEPSRRVCGYSVLVLILSGIIAVLLVAVIGLGAGAGILNTRVKNAEAKLAQPLADIDRGCSTDPDSVTATRYTSSCECIKPDRGRDDGQALADVSEVFDRSTYTIYCNDDAPNPPLQSLFVGNFDDCIDACASYSTYTRGNFPGMAMSANFTCSGVSFIPDWTNRTTAMAVNAPGNCYLKPGPQNSTALTHPSSDGPAVHAAILQTS